MSNTVSRKKVLSTAAGAGCLVSAVAVLSPQGLPEYRRLSNEAARLEAQNATLREENAHKRAEVTALKQSPRFQEKVVREDLGYVFPGEKLVIVETTGVAPDTTAQR